MSDEPHIEMTVSDESFADAIEEQRQAIDRAAEHIRLTEKLQAALKPWLVEFNKESQALDALRGMVREAWLEAVDGTAKAAKEQAEK